MSLEDEEEHLSSGDTHACTQPTNDQLGTATGDNRIGSGGGGGEEADMVNLDYYRERYIQSQRRRIKSIDKYLRTVDRLDEYANLSKYTRRQLRTKGKEIVLDWIFEVLPKSSWSVALSQLKSFWTYGIRLDWPIDPKRDLPKVPGPRPRETPSDELVKAWAEAMDHEPDLELRLYFYGISEHGWRPSHLAYLEWSHIRWEDEKPWAVIARSENFKTGAPVIAVLGPNFQKALMDYHDQDDRQGQRYIFPELAKLVEASGRIRRRWISIKDRYDLPYMTANDMRHWISSAGQRVGLSKPALAGLLGHDGSVGSMADWYNNPTATALLEEQRTKLPDGILALVKPPKVEIVHEHEEILKLWTRYLDGLISTMQFATESELLRRQHLENLSIKK